MDPLIILSLVLGLAVGSFMNVLISRLPDPHRSLFKPARSACPGCDSPILARDNIPVISYLWLRGKCRNCKKKIGIVYPLVELAIGITFVVAYLAYGPTIQAVWAAFFVVLLIGVAVTDAQTYLIPDLYTIGGYFVGVGLAFLMGGFGLAVAFGIDGLVVAFVLWALGWIVSRMMGKHALGLGDVFLVGMMAAFLGMGRTLEAIFLGSLAGAIFGIIHQKMHSERHIPFGLYLAAGGLLELFVGPTETAMLIDALLPWH